jgi:hypothetical protein
MNALKERDIASVLGTIGFEIPPEIAQELNKAIREQSIFQWRIKSFTIKDIRIDGGLAEVTVEETHFKDLSVDGREWLAENAKWAEKIRWGDNTVTETFVLVKLKGRWRFDIGHSGIDAEALNLKDIMKTLSSEGPDEDKLRIIAEAVNKVGFGQIPMSAASGGPALSAILVTNFRRAKAQGQVTACKSNLRNIGVALEMYATDNRGRYPDTLAKLTPNYLKAIPTCPAAGRDTYSEGYTSTATPDTYAFCCKGYYHKAAGYEPDFPRYNSTEGLIEQGKGIPLQ